MSFHGGERRDSLCASSLAFTSASSVTSATSSKSGMHNLQNTFFEAIYLTSSPKPIFWTLQIILMVADLVQLLSFCTDPSLSSWGVLSPIQRLLTFSRVSTYISITSSTSSSGFLIAALLLLGFLVVFGIVMYGAARSIQQSQVPNMLIIRFIRLTIMLMSSFGFIPMVSVLSAAAIQHISQSGSGIIIGGAFALVAIISVSFTLMATALALPNGFTGANPLSRLHSRVDVFFLVGKAVTVLLFQVESLNATPNVLVLWLAVFLSTSCLLYSVFIPYYRMMANIARTVSLFFLLAVLAGNISIPLDIVMICITPVSAAFPLVAYLATYIPMAYFRRAVDRVEALPSEADRDRAIANMPGPFLLFPFQVEIALRPINRRVRARRHKIQAIKTRLPTGLMELGGTMDHDGMINTKLVDKAVLEKLAQLEDDVQADIRHGLRVFQFTRARWRRSSFGAIPYLLYTAAYRWSVLKPAVQTCDAALAAPFWVMDVRYFRYICLKNDALNQDTSVMQRLEEQRNIETLRRSQKQLFEQLRQFWAMVSDSGAHRITVKKINAILRATTRISVLYSSVEKLYGTMLAAPTPATLQAYAHYITIVHGPETAGYSDELRLMAEDLNIRRVGDDADRATQVRMVNRATGQSAFLGLHIRAVLAILAITGLFAVAILGVFMSLQLTRHIVWRMNASLGINSGLQMAAIGFSQLRATGSPVMLAASSAMAGPVYKAFLSDDNYQAVRESFGNYRHALTMMATNTVTSPTSASPYSVLDVDLTPADQAIELLVSQTAQLLHTGLNPDALISPIDVVRYVAGSPQPPVPVDTLTYVAEVIHAVEGVVECVRASGVAACLAASPTLPDTFKGYEYTLATKLTRATLGRLSDSYFIATQLLPLYEAVFFVLLSVFLLVAFILVALALYIYPVALSVTFTVHLIQLFAMVPIRTLDAVLERTKSEAAVTRARSVSMGPGQRPAHFPGTIEIAVTRTQPHLAPPTPASPHGMAGRVVFSADTKTDLDDLTDTTDRPTLQGPDSDLGSPIIQGSMASLHAVQPTDEDSAGSMSVDTRIRQLETDSDSDSDPSDREMTRTVTQDGLLRVSPSGELLLRKRHHRSIRARYIAKQVPALLLWLGAFSVLFIVMACYSVYRTADVAQASEHMFIAYKTLNKLRKWGQIVAASSWVDPFNMAGTMPPVAPADAEDMILSNADAMSGVMLYLSGAEGTPDSVETAWGDYSDGLKKAVNGLQSVTIFDKWWVGTDQAAIEATLFSKDCVRLSPLLCAAPRPSETRAGYLNIMQAFITHGRLAAREIGAGPAGWGGPGATFITQTMELDVSGGIFTIEELVQTRMEADLEATETALIVFFVAFLVLMGMFYVQFFFRSIVQMTKTRRQFAVLFRSMPRSGVPEMVLDKFLEFFPDEQEG